LLVFRGNATSEDGCPEGFWGFPSCTCPDPFPTEALGITVECQDGVYRRVGAEADTDLFAPADTLIDFCRGIFEFKRNFVVPPSSNISLFRPADGALSFNGTELGQLRSTEGQILNYGFLFIVIPSVNDTESIATPDAMQQAGGPVPANGTRFAALLASNLPFDVANRTVIWQADFPFVQCQTIKFFPQITTGTNLTMFDTYYSIEMSVFDQCNHDYRIFVGVMAGVGGAIILVSIILGIWLVIAGIRNSMNQDNKAEYVEMER